MVYNSDNDGLSINAFARVADASPAPSIIIFEDKGGAVFR